MNTLIFFYPIHWRLINVIFDRTFLIFKELPHLLNTKSLTVVFFFKNMFKYQYWFIYIWNETMGLHFLGISIFLVLNNIQYTYCKIILLYLGTNNSLFWAFVENKTWWQSGYTDIIWKKGKRKIFNVWIFLIYSI